ncbi:hypothetical protein XH99_26965 [Bradyrhizobium nanningense]|uniref:Uncharacterized protein n=1 Tax=Bradyrhizobium nanningense TaxID=1325118 RepID=A0A4Q0RY04_9BRAD|nr:hypothetical protein XH99_26965 [Bradyrhizobium nanningense]RXH32992.1 hypothetical protein XH84_12180 [Bradyrhizobium nanningense]
MGVILGIFLTDASYLHVFRIVPPGLKRFHARIHVNNDSLGRLSVHSYDLRAASRHTCSCDQPSAMCLNDLPGFPLARKRQ